VKRAWAEAARAEQVRAAARGWEHAKAIDTGTLSAIEAAYPETRMTLHPAWRVLIFLLGSVTVGALFAGIFHSTGAFEDFRWPAAVSAAALIVATEILRGSRLSGTGADAATSFQALVFLLIAVALFLTVGSESSLTLLIAIACAAAGLAAWRWGFWFYALAAAVSAFVLVGRMPWARPAWMVLAVMLLVLIYPRLDRASIAPPHRRSLAAIFVVSAAALYTAVNLYAYDRWFIEMIRVPGLRGIAEVPLPTPLRAAAALATAAFPVFFLAWGLRSRRRLLIAIGLVSAVLTAATFRHYVPIGPRWAWLTACGVVLIASALWAHRRLRDAAGGTWRGLTASPLYSADDAGISPLGALGAHIAGPAAPEPERPGFTGGGGEFGGGGASGQY